MKMEQIAKIKGGRQDGAICNGYLFSLNHLGECTVYEMKALAESKDCEAQIFSEFVLDKHDIIIPHSNSVMFGTEYYDETDEFPLLYTNIYNNYANSDTPRKGVCLVYRLQRTENVFESTLVQMIEIGFTEDGTLWKSDGEKEDIRPYGNFVIDAEQGVLYAFTMRDNTQTTRYFSFALPGVNQGELCEALQIKRVLLSPAEILQYFDCDYHHFVQGASCHQGKIYSLEGFTDSKEHPPAIRVIDTKLKKETAFYQFRDFGTNIEPELIDFADDCCYYSDDNGNLYQLLF